MSVFSREYDSPKTLLLHEVMHLRVDPLNDGHQIVQNMFGVVHSWVHEVPKRNTGLFSRFNIYTKKQLIVNPALSNTK